MDYTFFALLSRMKYISRWSLMRSSRVENVCEHSMEVALISHALCVIGNVRYGKDLDANKAAMLGLYHDAYEIIAGDMPTPLKSYYTEGLKDAYGEFKVMSEKNLLSHLPDDLRPEYESLILRHEEKDGDEYIRRLVGAADKISALIKCMNEVSAGNGEFSIAKDNVEKTVRSLYAELPEVLDFVNDFLTPYGETLDELLGR